MESERFGQRSTGVKGVLAEARMKCLGREKISSREQGIRVRDVCIHRDFLYIS